MADSGNTIGQFKEEVEQAANEVASDVKDSVGEMIEQGVQTTFGPKLTPQQIQQKQLEDQKKLAKVRSDLKWHQDVAVAQKKLSEEEKQKKLQKQQSEEQEKQQKKLSEDEKKRVIISPAKQTPVVLGGPAQPREEIARSRPEIGKGRGIGG